MVVNLSVSDWVTIAFTFFSVLSGVFISWVFFRAQQKTDFKSLKDEIFRLNTKLDPNEITSILRIVERIDEDLLRSVTSILKDLEKEQARLSKEIQAKFDEQSKKSRKIIAESFRKEISYVLPQNGQSEALLSKLVDSFMDAMIRMGEYQRLNIEDQTERHREVIKQIIESETKGLVGEVENLKSKVGNALVPFK